MATDPAATTPIETPPAPSSSPGLALTTRLQQAAALMNRIPGGKFPFFLNRLLANLHVKDGQAFSESEEEQLQALFGLSAPEVRTIISAGTFIFEQAAYSGIRGESLRCTLMEAGLEEGHAEAAGSLWETQFLDITNRLRGRSMGGPKVLSEVDWHIQLMMGESRLSRGKDTTAILDLTLARPDVATQKDEEHVTLEFSHAGLYDFFLQLERIQEQLDYLS